jgi:prephenate dehydrogenase
MRVLVVGAAGAVGRLITDVLTTDVQVDLIDAPGVWRGDVLSPDRRLTVELRRAEVVVLAVPEDILTGAVETVAPLVPAGALLVQTASVQTSTARTSLTVANRYGLEAIGVNPLFAPAMGAAGRVVALVAVRTGARAQWVAEAWARAGARCVWLTPERHDHMTAGLQVAAHAAVLSYGLALRDLDLDAAAIVDVAPPPARMLLSLLARIVTANPKVYREIQAAHPMAGSARTALADGILALADTSPEAFVSTWSGLHTWLGSEREALAEWCDVRLRRG